MIFKGFNNGKFSGLSEITIPVDNLALERAYAVYEFFRINKGLPFYLDRHLDRFFNSLRIMGFEIAYNRDDLTEIINQLVSANNYRDLFVKIYAIPQSLEKKSPARLFILPSELDAFPASTYRTGTTLLLREYRRFIPDAKSTNYIASVFWKPDMEAVRAIDVLYADNGYVLESSRGNLFIIKDGRIFTPGENILKGITRSIVLDIMDELKMPYNIENVNIDRLFNADEIFITSTSKLVMPIVKIENKVIGSGVPGKLTEKIYHAYKTLLE